MAQALSLICEEASRNNAPVVTGHLQKLLPGERGAFFSNIALLAGTSATPPLATVIASVLKQLALSLEMAEAGMVPLSQRGTFIILTGISTLPVNIIHLIPAAPETVLAAWRSATLQSLRARLCKEGAALSTSQMNKVSL